MHDDTDGSTFTFVRTLHVHRGQSVDSDTGLESVSLNFAHDLYPVLVVPMFRAPTHPTCEFKQARYESRPSLLTSTESS